MRAVYLVALASLAWVQGEDSFNVLSMRNIPFPSSTEDAAVINIEYKKDIPEFTICYRFQIESYNDNLFWVFAARNQEGTYSDRIGWQTGMEREGFQGGVVYFD